MIPIRYIALDMDDVCNRLAMFVLRWLGCPVDIYSYEDYPPEAHGNLGLAVELLTGDPQYTSEKFWNTVPRKIWANVPLSEEMPWLLERSAALVGRKNVYFLTRPTDNPDCLAGKLDWIHRFMPTWMHRQYHIGHPKHVCARPDTLLIDDLDANVDAFVAEGGHGLLVPRPWNRNRTRFPRIYIHNSLEAYRAAG